TTPEDVATDAARAVVAATEGAGRVATLVLPADVCWLESPGPVAPLEPLEATQASSEVIAQTAEALRSGKACTLFVGGRVLRERGLRMLHRIAAATGARLLCETFPTRL